VKKRRTKFYDDLSAEMQNKTSNFIAMGDFNGHAGSSVNGYEGVHGGHRWGERNKEGERLLEFADSFNMVIGNTFFRNGDDNQN